MPKQPKYNSSGTIDLVVEHPTHGEIPFTASPTDSEAHGRELYARAMDGEFGPIAPYVAPVPVPPTQAQINAAAEREIQRLSIAAIPMLIEQMAATATGQAKAALLQMDADIKVELSKKK